MEILFIASELAPIVKVGGLADVVFALPKALKLLGHRVTVLVPRYPAFEEAGVLLARRLTPMVVKRGDGTTDQITVFDGRLGSGVDLIVIDREGYYGRPEVYGEGNTDYPDNAARFGLLCRAAVEILRQRAIEGTPFDVLHAHDWPTALAPYLLADAQRKIAAQPLPEAPLPPPPERALLRTASVLTIHNLGHAGAISRPDLTHFGLGDEHFSMDRLEFYGAVSAMKGGLAAADAVTTVSDAYARDVESEGHKDRFAGVLAARRAARGDGLLGILNGIDYAVWNPATDSALVARYDADDPSNKGRSKSALLRELELEIDPARPLIVSLGRVVHQKGADVLAEALPKILDLDVSVVIAGTGDPALEAALAAKTRLAPERARFLGHVPESRAHQLVAAADLVVVPSRYEPCGLVQMYAQRYGSLPVACARGGLIDSIVDADVSLETGTGFLFDEVTVEDLVGAVQRAVAATRSPAWGRLVKRVMRLDRSWDRPARRYAQIYKQVAQKRASLG